LTISNTGNTDSTMADYSRAGKIAQQPASTSKGGQQRSDDLDRAHKALFESGLSIRKAVAGAPYVEKALATYSSDFSRPMQEYVTESCWHSIWSRPGLDRKTRSLLNIAMLCAMGKDVELGVHVRGAVNNGASETEISETLLQAACYSGMPSGIAGFRVAEKVLNEIKAEKEGTEEEAKRTGSAGPGGLGGGAAAPVSVPEAQTQSQVEGGQSLNPS
jgi:4-carboxymuconolactone decarboxylase